MLLTWLALRVNARRFTVITVGVLSTAVSAAIGTLLWAGIEVIIVLQASAR